MAPLIETFDVIGGALDTGMLVPTGNTQLGTVVPATNQISNSTMAILAIGGVAFVLLLAAMRR